MRTRLLWFSVLLAAAALVPATPVRGTDLRGSVANLFNLGRKNTSPDVAAAHAQYERLKSANPNDSRLGYAYGVVLLNQHRYADALPLVDKYVAARPRDREAALVRLWALMQARRYPDALAHALAIVDDLPKPPPAVDAAQYLETARTLGKFFRLPFRGPSSTPACETLASRACSPRPLVPAYVGTIICGCSLSP